MDRALELLRERLPTAPIDAKEGEKAAKAKAISDRTLDRARAKLGVKAKHDPAFTGGWMWEL
jgi:hypothetical protein